MNHDMNSFPYSLLSLHGTSMQVDTTQQEDDYKDHHHANDEWDNSSSTLATVGITGRKMWKTLRERKTEAVWPPKLESALLEALQKYRPTSSKDPKQLQRFPKRNRFISDYVFHATGQRRTAKQVGSRLQQIRDTCSEEHILKLLTRPDLLPPPEEPTTGTSSNEEGSSHLAPPPISETPSPSYTSSNSPSSASYASTFSPTGDTMRHIPESPGEPSIQFDDMSFPSATPPPRAPSPPMEPANVCIEFVSNTSPGPSADTTMPANVCAGTRHLKIVAPDPLWDFVPTVSFTSSAQIRAEDCCAVSTVLFGDTEIHHEESEIVELGVRENKWLYGSKLVPSYWAELCKVTGQNLSNCRISQVVMKHSSTPNGDPPRTLFSVVYSFKHRSPPIPPEASLSFSLPSISGETQLPPLFPPTTLHSSYPYSRSQYYRDEEASQSSIPPTPQIFPSDTTTLTHAQEWHNTFASQYTGAPEQATNRTFDDMAWYYAYNRSGGSYVPCNISREQSFTPDISHWGSPPGR